MLEIPEAATLARQARRLLGRTVVAAVAGHSPHGFAFYSGDPGWYASALRGRAVEAVCAHAGMVEFSLGGWRLLFSDGARLRLLAADEKCPAKHQFLAEFDDGTALICTVQMYAGIALFEDGRGEENPYYRAARLSPSPLGDGFTPGHLAALAAAAKPALSAKGLLATEQRIPGLGNGCAQDVLFAAGVHPRRRVASLGEVDLQRLHSAVTTVLRAMTAAGGRDTEKDLFDRPGAYRTVLSARTLAIPCPGCGGPIAREAFLGGTIYFCAHCQPLPRPAIA